MKHRAIAKAGTGLAAGAVLTAPLLGIFAVGSLAGVPSVPFALFDWVIRVLPGRLVIFGLDLTLRVLEGLGFNIKNTAKTAEQILALASLFVAGLVIGLLFFLLIRSRDPRRIRWYGLGVGGALGIFSVVVAIVEGSVVSTAGKVGLTIWTVGLFLAWGWTMAWLYLGAFPPAVADDHHEASQSVPLTRGERAGAAPPPEMAAPDTAVATDDEVPRAEAHAISRRRFIIQMGGVAATILVAGSGIAEVLRSEFVSQPQQVSAPIPFPNAGSPVAPAAGTRPEYTAVKDHYRVDIDLTPPSIDGAAWRLPIDGLVTSPLTLTIDQIQSGYRSQSLFITLECISNPVGGPLIGTTLWTGVPFRDILAQVKPAPQAKYAHLVSADGFDETVDLGMVESDSRIMLAYAWNGQPLPPEHGFPLRIYIPDLYGMKQPKWIEHITLVSDSVDGYWVARGWDRKAERRTTSVIDTVATGSLVTKNGTTLIPIGGIADAGAKGISQVEVQVDGGPWQSAELRQPLSGLTWVIWRFDWPFSEGVHRFAVRAADGQGDPQVTQDAPPFPSGATGISKKTANVLPIKI